MYIKPAKEEEEDDEVDIGQDDGKSTFSKAAAVLRKADTKQKKAKIRQRKVDQFVPWNTNYEVRVVILNIPSSSIHICSSSPSLLPTSLLFCFHLLTLLCFLSR